MLSSGGSLSKCSSRPDGAKPKPPTTSGFPFPLSTRRSNGTESKSKRSATASMPDLIIQLRERAAKNPKKIVYPEATDPRILRAAAKMVAVGMVRPVLVGPPDQVEKKAQEIGVQLSRIEVVDPRSQQLSDRYAKLLLSNWKSRGITEVEAQKRLENPMYFAAAMVRAGDADGFVGGAATTTAETVRAAIHCIGLNDISKTVSSFFLMALPTINLIFADCAVVPIPTTSQLSD